MISVVRLRPPQKTRCGDYELDAFVVELAGNVLDFRFELGRGLGIFWALPAAAGDRLRLFHVDGAAYMVDEPELYEDPCVFHLPLTAWHGELGELADRSVVIAVTIEVSATPPRYRGEVTRRTVGGEMQTQTFAWAPEPVEPVAPTAQGSCSICAAIPPSVCVNTGRDETFGAPVTSLESIFDSRTDDLRRCPECAGLYYWNEDVAFTGSGNNDEETLTRMPAELQACIRAFMARAADAPEQIAEIARLVLALGETKRGLVLRHLYARRRVSAPLIPHYVAEAVRRNDPALLKELEWETSKEKAFAAQVLAAIEANPSPLLESLAGLAGLAACTTCGTWDDKLVVFDPDRFARHTGGRHDFWECEECTSMFGAVQAAGPEHRLARLPDWHVKTLRIFIEHAAPITRDETDSLLSYKQADAELIIGRAIEHDRAMVREMLPFMVAHVVCHQRAWIVDLLERFVAGHPADAALVVEAIDRGPRAAYSWDQKLVDELRAKAQAHVA